MVDLYSKLEGADAAPYAALITQRVGRPLQLTDLRVSCAALGLSSPAAACGADAEKGCRWSRCPQPKSKWLIGGLPFCPPHRPQPARCARCPRMCSAGVWLQPSSTMPPSLRLSPAAKMAPTTPFGPPKVPNRYMLLRLPLGRQPGPCPGSRLACRHLAGSSGPCRC